MEHVCPAGIRDREKEYGGRAVNLLSRGKEEWDQPVSVSERHSWIENKIHTCSSSPTCEVMGGVSAFGFMLWLKKQNTIELSFTKDER